MNKKSAALLAAMLIATTFSSLMFLNVKTALGSTIFNPTPPPPGDTGTNWNFDEGDVVSWQVDIYMDNALLGSQLLIYNISDLTYEAFNMSYTFENYYLVKLTEMYFNTTMNSLMEIPNRTISPIVNASLLNFTNMEMYADSEMEMPTPNYFLPDNGTTGLYLEDCARGLLQYYGQAIPSINMTYTINTTYDNELFFYDYGMPDYLMEPFTNSYVDLVYFDNGTLNFGEVFMNLSGAPFNLFEMRLIYTRNFDFNPIDEVVWGVEEGDVFYVGVGLNETKIEIVDIANVTDEDYFSWTTILVNESVWDFELEQWILRENDSLAGQANEFSFMPGQIVPFNTTGEDLAAVFGSPYSPYDYIEYDGYYMYAENTLSGSYMEMDYWISGIPNYIEIYDVDFDEYQVFFYKNMTLLSTAGIYSINFTTYGSLADAFNITTDINVLDSTEYYFRSVPDNPTNVSLPLPFDVLYVDLMVNSTVNIDFPINLTIEYHPFFSGYYQLWYFNASETVKDWFEVPITDDKVNTLTAQLNHTSIYALTLIMGDPPGPLTAWSNAGIPDIDGDFTVSWTSSQGAVSYNLYVYDNYITEINGTVPLVESGLTDNSRIFIDVPNGDYYYVVEAVNITGSTLSNNVHVIVNAPIPPGPFTVTADAGTPDADGKFNLNWTNSDGATSYTIFWSDHSFNTTSDSGVYVRVSNVLTNSCSIQEATSDVYYYRVRAYNATGTTYSNLVSVTVLLPPGPMELDSNAGTPDADGAFRLMWNQSRDAENYTVYSYTSYITEINGTLTKLTTTEITNTYYDITGIPDDTTIYYIIVAHNLVDNASSNCLQVDVNFGPPGAFVLSSNAGNPDEDGTFKLTWAASDAAKNYTIYVSSSFITKIDGNVTKVDNTTLLSYDLTKTDGTYYYIVVAFNDYGNSTSNCIKVVVLIPEEGDDDSGDDGKKDKGLQIPFSNFYLIFLAVSVIALVYYKKRKL